MDQQLTDELTSSKSSQKAKSFSDFFLIIRDRWLISLSIALPIALAFAYNELQVPESFRSSSSFRLIPPPAIINLQKVDQQEQQLQLLVAKHRDGLNSQELKLQVINKIENSPELKSEMLKPYLEAGIPTNVASTVSFSVSVSEESRPKFTISSTARSAKSAMIIAREVQTEYEILHKSNSSLKVESAIKTLERLLKNELQKETSLKQEMSKLKTKEKTPFLEDDKQVNATKKSQYQSEITNCRIEKLRINSTISQINSIQNQIKQFQQNGKIDSLERSYDIFKDFFKISEIEEF